MGREIVTAGTQGVAAGTQQADTYRDRLLKYIPGEVVVVWATIEALVLPAADLAGPQKEAILWIVFGVLLLATPLYQWRLLKIRLPLQLAIATVAFAVWVFYLGGPFKLTFADPSWYRPTYGAVLLPLYTFLIPLIEP